MKKFSLFIFLLIIAVALFGAVYKVTAADPLGTCYKNAGQIVGENVTREYCMAATPRGLGGETWGANTTPTPPATPQTPEQRYRDCIADGGSETDCRSYATATYDKSYKLLEPLPCKDGDAQCEEGKLASFDTSGTGKLGEYLNLMITLFIGLCAVAAVVMIVIGGIEYSTSELVSNKAAAKDRIQNALLGLLLALCSWLILYTINPDLLRTDFEISSGEFNANYQEFEIIDGDSVVEYSGTIPAGGAGRCQVGVERTRSGVIACKDVAQNVQNMMEAARAAGLNLTGGGFRTLQQQINLRIRNCGGNTEYNIYQKPNDQCSPPTAKPGTSRHESGKAIDFNCNGVLIRSQNNPCFIWLRANAARFGFYNWPPEPWHWSVDGK